MNNGKVKLLTCADEWSYHGTFDSEKDALECVEKSGYEESRCMLEYQDTGETIRVDNMPARKERTWDDVEAPLAGGW